MGTLTLAQPQRAASQRFSSFLGHILPPARLVSQPTGLPLGNPVVNLDFLDSPAYLN